jgi:hypothetical protein
VEKEPFHPYHLKMSFKKNVISHLNLFLKFFVCVCVCVWWVLGFGFRTSYWASTLPLELHLQPFLFGLFFWIESHAFAQGGLGHKSSYLCLPCSWIITLHHHTQLDFIGSVLLTFLSTLALNPDPPICLLLILTSSKELLLYHI